MGWIVLFGFVFSSSQESLFQSSPLFMGCIMSKNNNVRKTSVSDRANRHKIKAYKMIRDVASGKIAATITEQLEASYFLIRLAEEGNKDVCKG